MSKAAISLIQSGLRDLGYKPGVVDGLYGKNTGAAAKAWLASGGSPATAASPLQSSQVLFQGAARYPVHEACIHCAATRPDWLAELGLGAQFAEIRRWHLANGWRTIGYHWLIGRNGDILAGRLETDVGAGVVGRNNGVIHICLVGGHGSSERDRFSKHFTPAQDITLRQLLQGIGMRTELRKISGHNEYAAKACPGFTVSEWLEEAV